MAEVAHSAALRVEDCETGTDMSGEHVAVVAESYAPKLVVGPVG